MFFRSMSRAIVFAALAVGVAAVQEARANSAPTADAKVVGVVRDVPRPIVLTGSDPDLDPLTFIVETNPANGALSGTEPNLTYTPDPGFIGADSFLYKANDGTVDSSSVLVTLYVAKPANLGRIYFQTNRDGNNEIYSMRPDGSSQTNLTNDAASDNQPRVSPDGTKVAFFSDRDSATFEVYVMDADGANVQRITNATGLDMYFFVGGLAWEPDGSRLYFCTNSPRALYRVDLDGANLVQIHTQAGEDVYYPDMKPDGAKLVITKNATGNGLSAEIYTLDADGSNVTAITTTSDPDHSQCGHWSADGSVLLFNRQVAGNKELHLMLPDGSADAVFGPTGDSLFGPRFGPGEGKIVLQSVRDGNDEIYRIDLDGGNFTRLTNDGGFDGVPDWGNAAPENTADLQPVPVDTPRSFALKGSDPDGDPLTFSIVANGTKGTAVVTNPATGAVTYTPNAGQTGSDSFSFKVSDGLAESPTVIVSVEIVPDAIAAPPVIQGSARAVALDGTGNRYVTGTFTGYADFNPQTGIDLKVSAGGSDIFVTRFNADGTYSWTQTFGGTGTELAVEGNAIAENGGTVYLAGSFASSNAGIGGAGAIASAGSNDAFVLALDAATGAAKGGFGASGVQTFGGTGDDRAVGVAVTGGTVYATGSFASADAGIAGLGTVATAGSDDCFVLALDGTSGAAVTGFSGDGVQTFGGSDGDHGYQILVAGGTIYVVGATNLGSDDAGIGGPGTITLMGNDDGFVIALDEATGAAQTGFDTDGVVTFGGAGFDSGNAIAHSGSTIYLSGHFSSTDFGINGSGSFAPSGGFDVFVLALDDSTGAPVGGFGAGGLQKFGGSGNDDNWSLAASILGVFASAHLGSADAGIGGTGSVASLGGHDVAVFALDPATGAALSGFGGDGIRTFGGSGADDAFDLTLLGNRPVVTGTFSSTDAGFEGAGSIDATGWNGFLFLLNEAPVVQDETLGVVQGSPRALTLTGTDFEGDALTFSVVAGPSNGALTGTPPNLTYTPNASFVGADSFTYEADDGIDSSNTGTIQLLVAQSDCVGRIFFQTNRDGNNEIYSMRSDGTVVVNLTNNASNDHQPRVSPDGTKVAFYSDRDLASFELYIMNADGSNVQRVTNNTGLDLNFFPGGIAWEPDGSRLYFCTNSPRGLYRVDLDGSNLNLIHGPGGEDVYAPDLASDGSKLVVTKNATGNGTTAEIYTMNADGSNVLPITNTAGADHSQFAHWNLDGSALVFDRQVSGSKDLYLMKPDGSEVTQFGLVGSDTIFTRWSPENDRVVFATNKDGNYEIYTMKVDGSGLTQLTNDGATDTAPDWGPAAADAFDDSYTTQANTTLGVPAPGVLANDALSPCDAINVSVTSGPTNGTLKFTSGTGAFLYLPNVGFQGNDSFTYKVVNGTLQSNEATVNITVAPSGALPVAVITLGVDDGLSFDGLTADFTGADSFDPGGGTITGYEWDFGDGATFADTVPDASHAYTEAGSYLVSLVVTNDSGFQSLPATKIVVVEDRQQADGDLLVTKMLVHVNWPQHDLGVNQDFIKIFGELNPSGMVDPAGALMHLTINGVSLDDLAEAAGVTPEFKLKKTGGFSYTLQNIDVRPVLGIYDPEQARNGTVRFLIEAELENVTLDWPTLKGTFEVPLPELDDTVFAASSLAVTKASTDQAKTSAKTSSGSAARTDLAFDNKRDPTHSGFFRLRKTQASIDKTGAYKVTTAGATLGDLNTLLRPTGGVRVTIGDGGGGSGGDDILIPLASLAVSTGKDGQPAKYKYSAKLGAVPNLKSFTLDIKKRGFTVATLPLSNTGIPDVGDPDTEYDLIVEVEVPTSATDTFVLRNVMKLVRKAGSGKWKR